MIKRIFIISIIFLLCSNYFYSQEFIIEKKEEQTPKKDSLNLSLKNQLNTIDNKRREPIRAGIYSAFIPGLGQLYNKKYYKTPISIGLIATGIGFIKYYDNIYKKYHKAYKAQLKGETHEFSNIPGIDLKALANSQDNAKRYRDYSILITSLSYVLNILDAVVDAHLYEFKKDKDLAIYPIIINNNYIDNEKIGLAINFNL